jgi:hypothetical protein
MKKEGKTTLLSRQATKIKVRKGPHNVEDAAFFKKKMKKGAKMLAVAGLPK